jgi:uncharacterized CHY-type Zn-finger protein
MTRTPEVFGKTVDEHTRCVHYAAELDIIAIRFACCDRYYPCHLCHSETADHPAEQWPRDRWDQKAILCGDCWSELSIETIRLQTPALSAPPLSIRAARRIRTSTST